MPLTTKDAVYLVLDRENLAISDTVVKFTGAKITDKVVYAKVQVQVASIRVTEDGTDPNPAIPVGDVYSPLDIFKVWGNQACKDFKMIRETTTIAAVEVVYMGR